MLIYPRPKDVGAFEAVYNRDHVPMAVAKLAGKTKIVVTRVLGLPAGEPPFHRIAEVYFPSMEAVEQCAASEGDKQTIGECSFDFVRRRTSLSGRGGGAGPNAFRDCNLKRSEFKSEDWC